MRGLVTIYSLFIALIFPTFMDVINFKAKFTRRIAKFPSLLVRQPLSIVWPIHSVALLAASRDRFAVIPESRHRLTAFEADASAPRACLAFAKVQGDPAARSKPPVDIDLKLRFSIRTLH